MASVTSPASDVACTVRDWHRGELFDDDPSGVALDFEETSSEVAPAAEAKRDTPW